MLAYPDNILKVEWHTPGFENSGFEDFTNEEVRDARGDLYNVGGFLIYSGTVLLMKLVALLVAHGKMFSRVRRKHITNIQDKLPLIRFN